MQVAREADCVPASVFPGPQIAAWCPGAPSTLPRRSSCVADEKDGMPGREIAAAELSAAPARPAPVRLRPPAGRLSPSAPGSFFSRPPGCCCWPGAMRCASDCDLRCSGVAIATARRGTGESLGSAVMVKRPRSVACGALRPQALRIGGDGVEASAFYVAELWQFRGLQGCPAASFIRAALPDPPWGRGRADVVGPREVSAAASIAGGRPDRSPGTYLVRPPSMPVGRSGAGCAGGTLRAGASALGAFCSRSPNGVPGGRG